MTLVGADVGALRALGEQFEDAAAALDEIAGQVTSRIAVQPWQGPDGEQFGARWTGECRALVARTSDSLREAGRAARRNADAQERTSLDDGGAAGSGPLAGGAAAVGGDADVVPISPTMGRGRDDGRTPTEDILTEYQVSDGEVISWEPGWPANMLTDPERITEKEGEMLDDLSLLSQKSFRDIRDRAFNWADERFPGQGREDGHNDAFRHAMWNALMARKYGEAWAEDFGTAHEQRPGNESAREAMDLYNNEVGRRIEAENPDADVYELADLVEQAVRDGEMVVIDQDGDLAYSDEVDPGATGHPQPGPALPGEDPDFNNESSESA